MRFYRVIRTTSAVVCGGILAVMKGAWFTCTRSPGKSPEKLMERPKISKILVPGVTLKRTEEARLPSLMVVKVWFLWSMLMIRPVMRLAEVGRLISINTCLGLVYYIVCGYRENSPEIDRLPKNIKVYS